MVTGFMIGLLTVVTLAVITVAVITGSWLWKKVEERLEANKRHKVIFADMKETTDTYVREQKDKQKEYSMHDLERICQKSPYVFADYDMDTGEVIDYIGVNAKKIDENIKMKLKKRGGLVVFNS